MAVLDFFLLFFPVAPAELAGLVMERKVDSIYIVKSCPAPSAKPSNIEFLPAGLITLVTEHMFDTPTVPWRLSV